MLRKKRKLPKAIYEASFTKGYESALEDAGNGAYSPLRAQMREGLWFDGPILHWAQAAEVRRLSLLEEAFMTGYRSYEENTPLGWESYNAA